MKGLTSEELNNFPPDRLVWVMFDPAEPDEHVLGPINLDWELGLFAFLEKTDAEHMARLIKKDFGVAEALLRDLGEDSAERKIPLVVLDSENALDFFTRWPDRLSEYYGR